MSAPFDIIPVETDVLVIGGGLAGCMAAIKAKEAGVDVTLAEKGNIVRSGQNGTGIDHIWAYVPPIHGKMGWTFEDLIEDHIQGQAYGFINREVLDKVARESFNRVLDLEKFGVKFRYDDSPLPGQFRLVPQFHSVPSSFNFDGRNIKPILSREVASRKVRIINRIMITDLLVTEGSISGALGVSTRTGEIYQFKAKAVILCTGKRGRMCRNVTGVDFNVPRSPSETGDGHIMAIKAGCRLINLEFIAPMFLNIGPYHQSMGSPRSTTWPAGALIAGDGKVIVRKSFFTNWEKYLGEGAQKIDGAQRRAKWLAAVKTWPNFMDSWRRGEGPFFLDCTGGTEEEIRYVEWSIVNEGKGWLFKRHLEEEGLDLRKDKIEFTLNNPQMSGGGASGVMVDGNLETGVKGLYVAGDEMGGFPWGSSQNAVGTGVLTGEKAAQHAKGKTSFLPVHTEQLESLIEKCTRIVESNTGVPWKEAERAVQDIVEFYRMGAMTEHTLKRGIDRILDIKNNVSLRAATPHELVRSLEVMSVMDNAELALRASVERKETRRVPFEFVRADYPEQDDANWLVFLSVLFENGQPRFSKVPLR